MTKRLKKLALSGVICVLSACGSGGKSSDFLISGDELDNTHPYITTSVEGEIALACAKAQTTDQSCTLDTLAPIAMTQESVTRQAIMDRVLVSHNWMGERLETLLERFPDDMIYLFGGVTAIVIDDDIRPSYYTSLTGAIYLDPANLWLTTDEEAVISDAPDYREAYAAPLAFRQLWRYRSSDGTSTSGARSLQSIEFRMAALLFHELAHANDLFPRSQYSNAIAERSFYSNVELIKQNGDNASSLEDSFISTILTDQSPLISAGMRHIADILYNGATPTNADKQTTAAQVGDFLEDDGANDDYSYTSQYEDLAMLFEETMMQLHYQTDRDIAFADLPANPESAGCNDYNIGWGMRNRIGVPAVTERAKFVVERLLPQKDYSLFFDNLEPAQMIPVGMGWCESEYFENANLTLFEKSLLSPTTKRPLPASDFVRPYDLRLP